MVSIREQFRDSGWAIFPRIISDDVVKCVKTDFDRLDFSVGSRQFDISKMSDQILGIGGCFSDALLQLGLAHSRPVRILAFDKTPMSNWNLGWHQDRVIAIRKRAEISGFKNWTMKQGVPHAQPPIEILRNMFSLRLHLDDCGRANGALRIAPGSHKEGVISEQAIDESIGRFGEMICEAKLGEVLAMQALTLHASSPAVNPSHRRVLHVDYCAIDLPKPLEWAFAAE